MQAAHVEQVADQRVQPVGVLLDGGEKFGFIRRRPGHVGLPQAADRRLDRGERGAQVVADRGEQCGPHPVPFGQRLGLGGLGAQPFPVERGGGLGGVPRDQGRRGRQSLPGDQQGQVVADIDAVGRAQRTIHAARGDPDPGTTHSFGQFGLTAVGAGQVLQDGGRRVGPAEHGLRQLQQRGRLLAGGRGLDRAPGGQVDHAADGDRDRDEQQQGQQVPWLGDGKGVQRLGEVPVEQQAGRHRGEHGGPETAHHRDGHHRDQVDKQVVGQVQVRPGGRQGQGEQREQGRGQQRAAQPPPDADRALPGRRGLRPGNSGRGVAHATATSHARIPAHIHQCASLRAPAEHQAQPGAGQRAREDHDGRVRGGRPGRAQLRVRRPRETTSGEPADAGQQGRGDRLGGERHAAGDRRAEN